MQRSSLVIAALASLVVSSCGGDDDERNLLATTYADASVGEECFTWQNCSGEACLTEASGWPAGYCTVSGCTGDDECGDGATCHEIVDGNAICIQSCEAPRDCREGYACIDIDGELGCLPHPGDGPVAGEYGAKCLADDDCNRDLECDAAAPLGGYCLSRDCDACGRDAACGTLEANTACIQTCASTRDCRLGYVCRDEGEQKFCVPGEAITPEVPFDTTESVLAVTCDATQEGGDEKSTDWRIDFDVPESAEGFVVVPIVDRGQMTPTRLDGPGEITIDLVNDYRHHNLRSTELSLYDTLPTGAYSTVAFDWPIQVPYAPQFTSYVAPGSYSLHLTTTDAAPCAYVLEANQGSVLDINIHIVGIPSLSASDIGDNEEVQEALTRFREIYALADITIGEVRYYDAPDEIVERYSYIRDLDDIKRLTAWGQAPGPSLDEHLSVDVFLVRGIVLSGVSNILGVSGGVPGPPGMHGNSGNGLVFALADLGFDNELVGHIMAHEIGHYLGLRHTTEVVNGQNTDAEADFERLVGDVDPIEDTPVCENVLVEFEGCPDRKNLMFPAAPRGGAGFFPELSESQGAMLRINPLVK